MDRPHDSRSDRHDRSDRDDPARDDPARDDAARDRRDAPEQHRRLHGPVGSPFLAQPPHGYGRETWVDFLRDGAVDAPRMRPPLPPASSSSSPEPAALPSRPPLPAGPASAASSSADRKRRLTTAEPPMRRPSTLRGRSSSHAGSSADALAALVPAPALPPVPAAPRERPLPPPPSLRRESDLVLPPWQPDAAVAHCPVCTRQFTFLFRKHHCRKCGRVVCSQCSPHRITIPRQFIVHPPSDPAHAIIDLTGDDHPNDMASFGPFRNPALGGGEEVRVCNPCVPDPNYSLPPQYPSSAARPYPHPRPRPQHPQHPQHPPHPPHPSHARPDYTPAAVAPYQRAHRSASSVHAVPQPAGQGQTHSSRDSFASRRVSYHDASRSEDRWPSPLPTLSHVYSSHNRQHDQSSPSHIPTGPSYTPHPYQQRAEPDFNPARGANMFQHQFFIPPTQPPQIQQLNPRPRRQIAEEDECPICGGELPAKAPDGDDSARAQHVEECIALHSSSPAPSSLPRPQVQGSASLPATRTRGMSSAGNSEGASSHRHSHAARGMFPYTATEKDCVDEDGNDAECVICFEEFEAGDKMARLVCWCKFHEKCIKDWWKMKGRGACPTHQLHEE